jgi:hypothetical protein
MRLISPLILFIFLLCSINHLDAISADKLNTVLQATSNPFNYDLHLRMLPGPVNDSEVFICMHGMGSDHTLAEVMRSNSVIPFHIVAFNFPDYGLHDTDKLMKNTTFGSIDELLPALFVLKRCVVDAGADKVHLYGFSAGGGVIINSLALLNSNRYDPFMKALGLGTQEKQQILKAIENGSVILEVPLKSFDEIADLSNDKSMKMLAARANKNGLVPIQNIQLLQGLSLNCFVYFANPDEALGNRDDKKFILRLREANKGQTVGILSNTAGHTSYHPELWAAFQGFLKK